MQQGKHQEYEKKLYEQYNVVLTYAIIIILLYYIYIHLYIFLIYTNSRRPENSPPIQNLTVNNGIMETLSQNNKESWPSLNGSTSRNHSPGNLKSIYNIISLFFIKSVKIKFFFLLLNDYINILFFSKIIIVR